MYYIGIDIDKNHHEASIVDQSGNQVCRSLRFPSTHKGAVKLLEYIQANTQSNNLARYSVTRCPAPHPHRLTSA